jgi:hypothetical protein
MLRSADALWPAGYRDPAAEATRDSLTLTGLILVTAKIVESPQC